MTFVLPTWRNYFPPFVLGNDHLQLLPSALILRHQDQEITWGTNVGHSEQVWCIRWCQFSVLVDLSACFQSQVHTRPWLVAFFSELHFLWLRHYATSRNVAGSNPDEVIGFFNWPNPSSRTMALGLTHPLTEMSTRNLPGRYRAAGAWGCQPHRHLWADCLKNVGASTSHNSMGLHGLLQG
jgi:hypothetical protein